ncbi:hypothetical protein BGZ46_009980 [Entomortierella lignicola]|nr:hypothetical protein BGZ46_009980 [Entomortierella lignicola]
MFGCQAIRLLHLFSASQKTIESDDQNPPYSTWSQASSRKTITLKLSAAKEITGSTSTETSNKNNIQFNMASIDTPVTSPTFEQGEFDLTSPIWTSIAGSIYEKDEDAIELATPGITNYSCKVPSQAVEVSLTPETLASKKMDGLEENISNNITTIYPYVPYKHKASLSDFQWRHGGSVVMVTGTFDNWEKSIILSRSADNQDNFEVSINVPRSQIVLFKFIVDGVWMCSDNYATEYDEQGNLNNVLPAACINA